MAKFDRKFFDTKTEFTTIGKGSLGGKAQGLVNISTILNEKFEPDQYPEISVSIPTMTVLTTEVFDEFMALNKLFDIAYSDEPDHRIAHAFINSDFPAKIIGDLYALMSEVKSPLAIRSSSLLEDALYEPFAGIYGTKMIPNNQFDTEARFHKLIEAIKFVYASTFFKDAKDYFMATEHSLQDEKMAVIIQEVVGKRFRERFYPELSGVARSYNFYPNGAARPEEGIISLALGLGRTIVDDGIAWNYSPAYPRATPPYGNIGELMSQSQHHFWAINLAKMTHYDPVKETEYLLKFDTTAADEDKSLKYICSTYDPGSDRMYPGASATGTKIITFAPILQLEQIPLNDLVRKLLDIAEESLQTPVEIEFAVRLPADHQDRPSFDLLQIRPMGIGRNQMDVAINDEDVAAAFCYSTAALGNGSSTDVAGIVYVRPDTFDPARTVEIAGEIGRINKQLEHQKSKYLLIGPGRWGSADRWLGIPVGWHDISGVGGIIETTSDKLNADPSQGSHFFQNITSLGIGYLTVSQNSRSFISWQRLQSLPTTAETAYLNYVKLDKPLTIKIDGKASRGVVLL